MKQNLIDVAEFLVKAGNGGAGAVSFRREKYVPKGGPDGGDGGNGGSIYFVANPNEATLSMFAGVDRFEAEHGGRGSKRNRHGKDAEDLTIQVPVGTVVYELVTSDERREETAHARTKISREKYQQHHEYDVESQETMLEEEAAAEPETEWKLLADMTQPGERVLVAKAGAGGRGNAAFKSSVNTTPREAERGGRGEWKQLKLELKVLADIGLVGLPNAGKSTLLSVITKARPEIANYPFTTLSPNLGVMEHRGKRAVVADIPGLIEDAHKGKGLGIEFLRHIERCKVLLYIVAPMDEDLAAYMDDTKGMAAALWKQYETVRGEVEQYGEILITKPAIVAVNKKDLLSPEQVREIQTRFGAPTLLFSAATHEGVEEIREALVDLFKDS